MCNCELLAYIWSQQVVHQKGFEAARMKFCVGRYQFPWTQGLLIIHRGKITYQRYLEEILIPVVLLYGGVVGANFILCMTMHLAHRHRMGNEFLEDEGIMCLDWRSYSPELNPIEHVRDHVSKRVREHDPTPGNIAEMEQAPVNV